MARKTRTKSAATRGADALASEDSNGRAYERHLVLDHVVPVTDASPRERFEAVARSLRDLLAERWLLTQRTQDKENPKRVYYLSMEFLIGRTLVNNAINLGSEAAAQNWVRSDARHDWQEIVEAEPDAGLGNGGLGRLAACFIDSLATLQIPAMGYGLRYEYGIFRQAIENRFQVEYPDHWLARPDPWEVTRQSETVTVPVGCRFELHDGVVQAVTGQTTHLLGIPYDRPLLVTAVRRLTHCDSGARRLRTTSTSASSAPEISSARSSIASWPRR